MEFISLSHVSVTNNNLCFTIFVVLLSLFLCMMIRSRRIRSSHDKKRPTVPAARGSWPLLGHLPLLAGSVPVHLVLSDLADHSGPIFTVRLGVHRAIVVNTWEIAKEFLTTHERAFASRPTSMNSEILGYNFAMFPLSPYGPYWRKLRKIATLELFSNHRIELLKHVRESEVGASIKDAYGRWRNMIAPGRDEAAATSSTVLVDMTRWFGDMILNITLRMIIGKRFHDGDGVNEKERQTLKDFIDLMGRIVVSDALPFLRWLDVGGYEKAMRRTAKALDDMMQRWLDEHKAAKRKMMSSGDVKDHEVRHQDFMDVILSTLEDHNEEVHTYDADTINKATCLALVLAGSDTTTNTLEWALSLLLNHKQSLKKVQHELDINVGRDRQVKESDLKNLPYLQAVIKETLRLYPPGSLIPREAKEDCTFQDYFIPKGTRLLLNPYNIQRDSTVWPNPSEFMPERFLNTHKNFDVRNSFEFIPFGGGRRMCPAVSLALLLLGISLASFLHAFEVKTPRDEPVDMAEVIGLTNSKANPVKVLIKPRLPDFMYQ